MAVRPGEGLVVRWGENPPPSSSASARAVQVGHSVREVNLSEARGKTVANLWLSKTIFHNTTFLV
eukprot:167473-Amphidinium_carterae.1